MNVKLDFICMGFAEQWETGKERKIQNENLKSSVRFEPATFNLARMLLKLLEVDHSATPSEIGRRVRC